LVAALALLTGQSSFARGHHSGGGGYGGSHSAQTHSGGHSSHSSKSSHAGLSTHAAHAGSHTGSKAVPGVNRDAHGKIARLPEQKAAFKDSHPCPSTGRRSGACPGYVIDHVVPLKRGGPDRPENMQWQTTAAAKAKAKDKME
jgi:hypothetical protein